MTNKTESILSIQNRLLTQLQQAETPVAVYLQNGIKLKIKIAGLDTHVSMLHSSTANSQMIYKHAILTFQPQEEKPVL